MTSLFPSQQPARLPHKLLTCQPVTDRTKGAPLGAQKGGWCGGAGPAGEQLGEACPPAGGPQKLPCESRQAEEMARLLGAERLPDR